MAVALWIAAGVAVLVWLLLWWRRNVPVLERSGAALVPAPPNECACEIAEFLATWPEARSIAQTPDDHSVELRTYASRGGFGERVTILTAATPGGSLVTVSSRPVHWATVLDYGRNRRNVDAIVHAIAARYGGTVLDPGRDAASG